jgi:hypothetical protein
MKARIHSYSIFLVLVMVMGLILPSCRSTYCPGVDGTGNSASRSNHKSISIGKPKCPAVAGTGNYKPKLSNKKEDGLTSPKMARAMAKAERKKASPIQSRKLSFE